jgi:hypothetical protein
MALDSCTVRRDLSPVLKPVPSIGLTPQERLSLINKGIIKPPTADTMARERDFSQKEKLRAMLRSREPLPPFESKPPPGPPAPVDLGD